MKNTEYFASLVELLDLDVDRANYLNIAKQLEKSKNMDILIYHRHSFVFEAFLDLLNEKISLANFMQVGDILSDRLIFNEKKLDSETFLGSISTLTELDKNKIYLVDKLAYLKSGFGDLDNLIYC